MLWGDVYVYHLVGRYSRFWLQKVIGAKEELRLAVSTVVTPVVVGKAKLHESLVVGKSHVTFSSKSPEFGTASAAIRYGVPAVGFHDTALLL